MGFLGDVLKQFTPAVWVEKPVFSQSECSLVFLSQNQAMCIIGYKEKPNLDSLKSETGVRLRFIDQGFVLLKDKNSTNDQILALRKKKESRDLISWFSRTNPEEEKRLRMLETKQKDQSTYRYPYLLVVSSANSEATEHRAAEIAEATEGMLLAEELLLMTYNAAAWDQIKELNSVGR